MSAETIHLPKEDGTLHPHVLGRPRAFERPSEPLRSRVLYAAAHVVGTSDTGGAHGTVIDWKATLAYRRHLWSYGLGVAEAMDTAQRGMGLSYAHTVELIEHSIAEARSVGGSIVCGASTDQLPADEDVSLSGIERAYLEQCSAIEGRGGRVVLMASRHLARTARRPEDYRRVYRTVLRAVDGPVILHWLGDMFDPALAGYWGSENLDGATRVCLDVLAEHADKVEGIKLSLLDDRREIDLRRRLPDGVRMYTGDDFHYDDLILGDETGYSHALLGIFDGIAPAASAAIQALDRGDVAAYRDVLGRTWPLARHVFAAPTYDDKTGIVFLAYLNGHQTDFRMVGGLETARSVSHLATLFRLADAAGLLHDPGESARRMRTHLAATGAA